MNIDQEAVGHLLFPPSVRPSARLPLSSIRSSPSVRPSPSSVKSVGPWHFRFSVRRPLPRAPARPPAIRHSQRLLSLADSTSTFAADPRSFSQSRRRISSRRRKFFVQQWTAALRVTTTVFSVSDSVLSLALPCSFALIFLFFFPLLPCYNLAPFRLSHPIAFRFCLLWPLVLFVLSWCECCNLLSLDRFWSAAVAPCGTLWQSVSDRECDRSPIGH